MLQADTVRPADLTPEDRRIWDEFRALTPEFCSPLLSYEFAEAVARVREDARVTVFRDGGKVVGFLAHHRRPGGLARPIGSPWSDYQALITAPEPGFDGREALRAAGLSAFRFGGLADPHGLFAEAEGKDFESYVIDLHGKSGEDYWEGLRAASPKRFKNMRRLEHKLAREVGEPRLVAPDHEQAAFDQLLDWKSEQLVRSGLHDVLGPAWSRALMQSLFAMREGPLQGLLISLKIGERTIASHFGVRLGDAYHPWIAAYDAELAAYSPGITFLSEATRAMPALGLASYDLSGGSDHYKRPYASDTVQVREGVMRTGRGGLGDSLASLTGVLGERRAHTLRRVGRRLDHIAATELSLAGRVQGFAHALAASSRRLEAQSPSPEGEG